MRAQYFAARVLVGSIGSIVWAQGVIGGAGYVVPLPPTVAPNQIVTFLVTGLGAVPKAVNTGTPIGNTLGGVSAVLKQFNPAMPVSIFSVEPLSTCPYDNQPGCATVTAITVLIPPAMRAADPSFPGVLIPPTQIVFTGPNSASATVDVNPLVDQIHVLATCDLVLQQRQQSCQPLATHADGTFITTDAPAKPGEEIVIYVVGIGDPNRTRVQFDYRVNALPSRPLFTNSEPATYIGGVAGYQGLYQVNVVIPEVPPGTPACSPSGFASVAIASNLTISIGGVTSFHGAGLCLEVPGS